MELPPQVTVLARLDAPCDPGDLPSARQYCTNGDRAPPGTDVNLRTTQPGYSSQ
jgi:hypothetical protein